MRTPTGLESKAAAAAVVLQSPAVLQEALCMQRMHAFFLNTPQIAETWPAVCLQVMTSTGNGAGTCSARLRGGRGRTLAAMPPSPMSTR
jgi:hypothetical protein